MFNFNRYFRNVIKIKMRYCEFKERIEKSKNFDNIYVSMNVYFIVVGCNFFRK